MSSVIKTIFGGKDDSAQKAQIAANDEAARFIKQQTNRAMGIVERDKGNAYQNVNLGAQAASDMIRGSVDPRIRAMQGGNVNAQNTLLEGLPQIQRAILGLPTDTSGMQAQWAPANLNFLDQGFPEFGLQQNQQQNQQQNPFMPQNPFAPQNQPQQPGGRPQWPFHKWR